MKGTVLKITFAAALAVVAGVTAYQAQDKKVMSDLALANVEALARIETTTPSAIILMDIVEFVKAMNEFMIAVM
ncbi:MAG TPA: NVEALA domain-containing protein [Candidatus Paraprevotella stercorigallinarum]|nr:NVEALA domain-containing protein [Candidatus Paraprevotella stercorigallinarum]